MGKQKWLWGILILLLVVSSPGIINRWQVETTSNNYEMIIPYEEISVVADESDYTIDEVFETLKDAGLTTVSLEPTSLQDLEDQNVLSIYEENELANALLFTSYEGTIDTENTGYYITVPEDEIYQQVITEAISPEKITIADRPFYFLSSSDEHYELDTPFSYNKSAIENVHKSGLKLVFRVENAKNETVNDNIVQQLLSLKDETVTGLLGSGEEILGFGQDSKNAWLQELVQADYNFYTIEGNLQKGEYDFAKSNDYEMIRLHSIDVNKQTDLTVNEMVDRTTRAVKERNIKSIFYHIRTTGNANDNLTEATDYLASVQASMPSHFTLGEPKQFEDISIPAWVTATVLLAGILFTYLMSELLKVNKLRIAVTILMALIAVAYFVFNRILFLQGFALIIAVLTPIYAVIKSANGSRQISRILLQYLKALVISFIGIFIVIGLLNGNGFLTGYEIFRGVKLVYIIPILGLLLFVLFEFYQVSKNGVGSALSSSVRLLDKEVKYWHLVIFVIIAGIGLFYIGRTGNYGSVSNLELLFRQWLENALYVRPRTKEFLIGFPFFILALYVMGVNKKWGTVLLVPGVIGFLSMVNTFTHLHIPVSVSLLRTVYSATFGFVIGLVFIVIFKILYHYFSKVKTKRWS